ncbi:MAG: oxidoreductase [Robiginitomaculum sp.]|nr:MAG: oxidoreductase [Robiginitomaculum sp.]
MIARIGVVGIGWWASFNHIPTIGDCPEAEIVAICDLDPARLAKAGAAFGIAARYTDMAKMLTEQNLDGVMISTPHTAHTAPAIAALEAGAHVLVEKPMATTAADGRAIARAAAKAGREVMVPTSMNFTHASQQAAQWVADGRIGEVRHAVCQMGSALEDLISGQPMLETEDHLFRPPASTWADPTKAGGYGWGQMSHSIGWLLYVSDLTIETVFCIDGKSTTGVDFYDAAVARATNGATISISGAATTPKHMGMHTDVRIYGTKGMVVFDNERVRMALHLLDGTDEFAEIGPEGTGYDGTLPVHAFAKLCAGHVMRNPANAENGARVTETLDALYRSAASGQIEKIGC